MNELTMYTTTYKTSARGKIQTGHSFHADLAAATADRTAMLQREFNGRAKFITVLETTIEDLVEADIRTASIWAMPQFNR